MLTMVTMTTTTITIRISIIILLNKIVIKNQLIIVTLNIESPPRNFTKSQGVEVRS